MTGTYTGVRRREPMRKAMAASRDLPRGVRQACRPAGLLFYKLPPVAEDAGQVFALGTLHLLLLVSLRGVEVGGGVRAVAALELVGPGPAGQRVVPVPALEHIVAVVAA